MSGVLPRILVFGCRGQVGTELTRLLTAERAEFTAYDREECDLMVPNACAETIRSIKPAIIVNAAAYTAVDRAESEQAVAERLNAGVVAEMARAAKSAGAVLIHYSTDYVLNGRSERPWREDDPVAPLNAYGKSKLHGEEAIRESAATAFTFRTSWVYGAHGANFLLTMLRLGAEREELSVVADQRGAPTWSRNLAEVALHVIKRISREDGTVDRDRAVIDAGLYHASAAGETTWHEFAEAIFAEARSLGFPVRVKTVRPLRSEEWPTPAERPRYSVLDNDRLRTRLGFVMPEWRHPLAEILREVSGTKAKSNPSALA